MSTIDLNRLSELPGDAVAKSWHLLGFTVISNSALQQRERDAYELGRECGPPRSQPGHPSPRQSRPRHLHTV